MPFDSDSLAKARSQGYTDDQIYDHLAQSDERFRVAKQNGYSLDDIASHLTKKGGEQTNEQDQPQAYSQSNAERGADQQNQPSYEGELQADGQSSPRNGQERVGNINPSDSQAKELQLQIKDSEGNKSVKGGDLFEKDAKAEGQRVQDAQGKEDGQAVRPEGNARNEAEVKRGGVLPPALTGLLPETAKQLSNLARGAAKGVSEIGDLGIDLLKMQYNYDSIASNAKQAEAIFGKNKYTDAILNAPEDAKKIFRESGEKMDLSPEEKKSPLNGFVFGLGKLIPDIMMAAGTEGGSAVPSLAKYAIEPVWKTIGEKAIQGMKAFSPASVVAANTEITNRKENGATDSEALAGGMKALIETEAGAALPMQVSSALPNLFLRGASRVLQSVPLAVAQNELATAASNMMSTESKQEPTITENILSGNFKKAESQLAQSAGMGVMGLMGEKTEVAPDIIPKAQTRLEAAAFKTPEKVYTGANHDEALKNALDDGAITQEFYDAHSGNENAEKRNAENFGFTTNQKDESGNPVIADREDAYHIAKASKQSLKQKKDDHAFPTDDGAKLHSHETELDLFDENGKPRVPPNLIKENPTEAVSKHIQNKVGDPNLLKAAETPKAQNWVQRQIKKLDLFRDDIKKMGVVDAIKKNAADRFSGTADQASIIVDLLDNQSIPALSRAGVKEEAAAHAYSRSFMEPYVDHLISQVFPNKYWLPNAHEEIGKTMDIINKDNILGGADTISDEYWKVHGDLEELKSLYEKGEAPRGAAGQMKDMQEKLDALQASYNEITEVHDLDKYEQEVEAAKGTEIEKDINRWKQIVHPQMDELFKKVNNLSEITQTDRGRVFGARVNLLADWEAQRIAEMQDSGKPFESTLSVDYRNPDIKRDKLNRKAIFNATYSNDVEKILMNSFASRVNEATKLDFYNALVREGVAQFAEGGEKIDEIAGKPTVRMEAKVPVYNERTGKSELKNKSLFVQKGLSKEIENILQIKKPEEPNPFAKAVTTIQLKGIADGVTHLKSLHSTIAGALGRDSIGEDLMSKIPIVGSVSSVNELIKIAQEIHKDTPEIRKEKAEIARIAGIKPSFEKDLSDRIGNKRYTMHDLIHDADMAARIILNRRYKNLVDRGWAKDTIEDRANFINRVGEYNTRMMPRFQAMLKNSGWSPFVVAGRAMGRNARQLVTGDPGFETTSAKAHLQARALHMAGLAMATLLPALINSATTGSMLGRAGTPIGAIDFGPNFDTNDGKHRVFDLFQLIGIRRGLRQLGLNAMIEGVKNGDTWKNIQDNVINDVKVSSLHPFIGPALGFGVQAGTGQRIDLRSGYTQPYTSRKIGGAMQYVENARTALKQQNELVYSMGPGALIEGAMGMYKDKDFPQGIPRPVEQNQSESFLNTPKAPVVGGVVNSLANTVSAALGGKLNVSPALKLSAQLGSKQQYDPYEDIRYAARSKVMNAVRNGRMSEAKDLYEQGLKDGVLTKADNKALKYQIKQPDLLVERTARLKTAEDALSVFRVATPEEQDKIAGIVVKKIKNSSSINPLKYKQMVEEFKKVAKAESKIYKEINPYLIWLPQKL